jgi:cellulose synthase/poly-beta-1,6-N-acetylglucosamine synthase-like glycosyltransferase
MIIGLIIISSIYLILIGCFVLGFSLVKEFNGETSIHATKFSIIIPFRNEVENLPGLLKSLDKLDYPKNHFEVILIDDDSDDDSVELIMRLSLSTQLDFKIIKNKRQSNSPKKDAISTAMHKAKYDWVVTTDADCIVHSKWLNTFNAFITAKNPKMVIAPVTYHINNSFLAQFQLLDFMSLQGATIAGFALRNPFLCNGANMAYKKELFTNLHGFEGNNNLASGDDIFLLEKATKKYKKQVRYLKSKNAIVVTKPQPSIAALIQQRVRWAAKASAYKNVFGKVVGLIVLLMNGVLVLGFVLTLLDILGILYFGGLLAIKLVVDYLLIYKTAHFYTQKQGLKLYIICGFFYPLFFVFVAVYAMFFDFKWKGRTFKA